MAMLYDVDGNGIGMVMTYSVRNLSKAETGRRVSPYMEKLGRKWDVERDYFDWELAETELPSLRRALRRLRVED